MKQACHCYSIPAGKAFINALADWLLAEYGGSPDIFSRTLVLLPTRRTCRALRDAFLQRSGGRAQLLPRIQPLGEADEEFTAAHYGNQQNIDTAPAISPLSRQLLLTRLVHAFQQKDAKKGYNLEQSAKLARQLATFLDDVAREELKLDALPNLLDGELATHWQETLEFLSIISKQWPAILQAEELSDPVSYRNQLLHATAAIWQAQPPSYPVIAAGSTGSQPAAAALMATIAALPQGKVILPALDQAMSESHWDMLGETHPQFALKQLLEKLHCHRRDVKELVINDAQESSSQRVECLHAVFQPSEATMHWREAKLPLAQGLKHIRTLSAATQFDEARMLAIALRETLETKGKTAALITPDRTLARMVAALMRRFGITIDDSAGTPLKDTPAASFMRLAMEMITSAAAPSPLLALLRHPLAAAGMEPSHCRLLSRTLEIELLRGIRLTPGLGALCHKAKKHPQLLELLSSLHEQAKPLIALMESKKPVTLHELLTAHIAFAQWLASTPKQEGQERLWAGESGNALASFLAQLMEHSNRLEPIDPSAYSGLLETLMAEQVYRPLHGLHPRLHILGPMEARLQHFDLVILGGLNEGTWPTSPQADPWMSRPMRSKFGLPSPEYAIGLAAHDVFQFCCAPEVILSRARKVEGTPTVPSRWLVRLETLVAGLDKECLTRMNADAYFMQGTEALDAPQLIPALEAPAPKPPLAARPRKLRVTAIDRWLRDPYAIYAQYILSLKCLPELDEEPDAADFGNLVHQALEQFALQWPSILPPDPLAALMQCGKEAFADYLDRPAVACLWWPRFENIAGWIIEREIERRATATRILAEYKGMWELSIDGKPFTLTTSIDRIELAPDGSAAIVDYKTGNPPEKKDFDRGLANQLPLEALIVLHGKLTPELAPPSGVRAAEYWKLAGSAQRCEINEFSKYAKEGIDAWLSQTRASLEALVRRFDQESEPYAAQTNPALSLAYNDYEHLTRRKEWEAV